MSKKLTIQLKDQSVVFQEFNGSIVVQRTLTVTDWRGNKVNHPTETLFSVTPEEAGYLGDAFNTLAGRGTPLEPKEKIETPAEAVAAVAPAAEEKAPTT